VDGSQFERVTSTLDSLEQWPAAFMQVGEEHLVLARAAQPEGRPVHSVQA
jgi:hypothetical protein